MLWIPAALAESATDTTAAEIVENAVEVVEEVKNMDISIMEALMFALVGFIVVFVVLFVIIGAIVLTSKLLGAASKKPAKKEAPAQAAPAAPAAAAPVAAPAAVMAPGSCGELKTYNVSDKDCAMIMAIVADEMKTPLNELRFISIKEIAE